MEQQPNVIEAINVEKTGEEGNKPPEQIIKEDSERQGLSADLVFRKLAGLKKTSNQVRTIQIGNTVFLVTQVQPGTVECHIFTNEPPNVIGQRYVALVKLLKSKGMKRGYTYSDEPGFKRVAESTGLPVKVSQTTMNIGNQIKPVYRYDMEF
jgi:hypothetical protein